MSDRPRPMRMAYWSMGLLIVAAIAIAIHFGSPHATIRVTTGAFGTESARFITALTTESAKDHPLIRFQPVPVADLQASSAAIESGTADLALIRSDVSPPPNGQTIAIIRRDAVALVLPPKSPVDSISKLVGKTIGIPEGRLQVDNSALLDTILTYYNVPPKDVHRVFLPPDAMVAAVHQKQIAAILSVGPVAPGEAVAAVSAMAKGTGGTPTLLAFADADAFHSRYPAFESLDIPEGGLRTRPATPDDTVTTLSVSYRLVASDTMLDVIAGAIARDILTGKPKLVALTPLASQIEAPDPDDKNPILPVHPGVANYLNNGQQSFFDEFQSYFYVLAAVLSVLGSLSTAVLARLRTRRSLADQARIGEMIQIADAARGADEVTLDRLEETLHRLVDNAVASSGHAGDGSTVSLAVNHARYAIQARRGVLLAGGGVAKQLGSRQVAL